MALKHDAFDVDDSCTQIRLYLSPFQKAKVIKLKQELNLSSRELFVHLLDSMLLDDVKDIAWFRYSLSKRLKKGVGYSYIIQLKLLYSIIGIFLKKINHL